MLQKDFKVPDPAISQVETAKRTRLLEWAAEKVHPAVTNLFAAGSMATGKDYSVTPKSDIDIIATVTPETAKNLLDNELFQTDAMQKALEGYDKGIYKQFSFTSTKEDVPLEFHFWDEAALIELITYQKDSVIRLRTNIDKPSADSAHSFDGTENSAQLPGRMIEGYPCGDFPAHREIDGKLFLCRPITNVLALPNFQIINDGFRDAVDKCWQETVIRLQKAAGNEVMDTNKFNIINALPGNNKISPESKQLLEIKTQEYLQNAGDNMMSSAFA